MARAGKINIPRSNMPSTMSSATSWVVLYSALFCLACASAFPRRSNCTDFLHDFQFDEGKLEGIWKSIYTWPTRSETANDTDVLLGVEIVSFYPLVVDEVNSYSREMSSSFPTISWDKVRFTWNLAARRPRFFKTYGHTNNLRFLLEFGDDTFRAVSAVPAGETYGLALKTGSRVAPLSYQFRMLGDFLAVAACETNSAYLLHKGIGVPEEAEVQRVVASVTAGPDE